MLNNYKATGTYTLLIIIFLINFLLISVKNANAYSTSDLNQMVEVVRGEIELIRQHKQVPLDERDTIPVDHVFPREVYFQALTLRQKAGRLCHEATQSLLAPPVVVQFSIPVEIAPKDIYEIVNDAWSQIRCAKAGI